MQKPVTLEDIACRCGMSKSTVAQVIRDPKGCKASLRTRDLVLSAARELDYHPNYAARALSTRRTYTIGVLFPAMRSFYDELSMELCTILESRGYYGLFGYWDIRHDASSAFRQAFMGMKHRGVDGVITCEYDESLADADIPVVTYGNERRLMDCVYPDKADFARRAIQYLYARGHRSIAFCGVLADIRYTYFRQAMEELGLTWRPEFVFDVSATLEEGYEVVRKLFGGSSTPTAIVSHSDCMSQGILGALWASGKKVPDDVSVLSYDNMQFSAYTQPPLTTFDQNFQLAAQLLADTILRRIKNPGIGQQKRTYKMSLIERKSVTSLTKGESR